MANIRKMLDMSTAHLTPEMRDELDDAFHGGLRLGADGAWHGAESAWGGAVGVYPTEHGALVWVPDDPEESAAAGDEAIPLELIVIQKYARRLGCDYVLFDADGPVDDALDVFERPE
jgi:hypothetical protein